MHGKGSTTASHPATAGDLRRWQTAGLHQQLAIHVRRPGRIQACKNTACVQWARCSVGRIRTLQEGDRGPWKMPVGSSSSNRGGGLVW
jgi:hypothetical protein